MAVDLSPIDELIEQGDSLRNRGRYKSALRTYALAAAKQVAVQAQVGESDIGRLWYITWMSALCVARLGDHEVAVKAYDLAYTQTRHVRAESDAETDEILLRQARIQRDRADSLVSLGRFDDARRELRSSTIVLWSLNAEDDQVINDHFAARIERKTGDEEAERRYLLRAVTGMARGRGLNDQLYLRLDYASWLVRRGQPERARYFARKALGQALQQRSIPHIVRSLQLLVFAKRPQKIHAALYGRN